MSLVATKVIDREKLFFGLAKLYIGLSSTYEASTTPALSSGDYFSSLVNVSMVTKKESKAKYKIVSAIKILEDILITASGIDLAIDFIEMSEKALSFSLGGDGSDTNILNNLMGQGTILRAELLFTYPNGSNTMTMVFPKVRVTSSPSFKFESENPMQVPLIFSVLYCSHINWVADPMGKIIFA